MLCEHSTPPPSVSCASCTAHCVAALCVQPARLSVWEFRGRCLVQLSSRRTGSEMLGGQARGLLRIGSRLERDRGSEELGKEPALYIVPWLL
eukprot:365249-Chlamydomonas_euryale.AAC.3